VGATVNPVVDPASGEPEFKHTPARLERIEVQWHGFLLSRDSVPPPPAAWWAVAAQESGHRLEFGGNGQGPDGEWLRGVVRDADGAEWIEYSDPGTGTWRTAVLSGGRLIACMMVTRSGILPPRSWLTSLLAKPCLEPADRSSLLRGVRRDVPDPGLTVCACFQIGANSIRRAVQSGCNTVEGIGAKLRAGTNCGSCRPEIQRLLRGAG